MLSIPALERSEQRTSLPTVYRQSFEVRFEYEVYFDRDVFALDNHTLLDAITRLGAPGRERVGIVVERAVARAFPRLCDQVRRYIQRHGARLELAGISLLEGGEAAKNAAGIVEDLQRQMLGWRIDRHAYLIAIGGGALLDLVGYAAATFHRGVRHVRFPTTVLAQNDSGVGVKNAVNALGLKNLIGTFAPPFAVINDFDFLEALPVRERVAGMAEAVKVALIRDAQFFRWLELNALALRRGERAPLERLIQRCAELHMHQIARGGDPFERGSARPLDFGHWAAHKLETLTDHALRHGEAVAIGVALDTRYSVLAGLLPEGSDERVHELLTKLGFSLWHDALSARDQAGELTLLGGLRDFREHLGGELTITLLREVGVSVDVHHMDGELVRRAIDWLHVRGLVA